MTIEDLISALETAKFNVFYGEAPDGTVCPYVVLTDIKHPNFAADNSTYAKTTNLRLRLIEDQVHDWDLIDTLEETLDSLKLPYWSTDVQAPSEGVCETYYDLTFQGGTKNA